jgi:hypothetical protein
MAFYFTDLVFKVTNWTDTRFTHIEKAVLNALATRADEQGKCFPGFTCLVSDTGVSRGRLSDAIANIKELGLVEVEVGHRGKFRYALNEDAIAAFGGLDEEDELAYEKPKGKTIRGKNDHTYTRKADAASSPAEDLCEICGKIECVCLTNDAPPVAAETFNKMTCPKCEVTNMMTRQAYVKHISICTGKVETAPPSLDVAKTASLSAPIKSVPIPASLPPPPEPPKVKCSMPHCAAEGTEEQVAYHMTEFSHTCRDCKTAYHTKFELSACEDKHLKESKAKWKAKEEAEWAAMEPWQRRAKWEKDKEVGTRAGWKKFGRWTGGEKLND